MTDYSWKSSSPNLCFAISLDFLLALIEIVPSELPSLRQSRIPMPKCHARKGVWPFRDPIRLSKPSLSDRVLYGNLLAVGDPFPIPIPDHIAVRKRQISAVVVVSSIGSCRHAPLDYQRFPISLVSRSVSRSGESAPDLGRLCVDGNATGAACSTSWTLARGGNSSVYRVVSLDVHVETV